MERCELLVPTGAGVPEPVFWGMAGKTNEPVMLSETGIPGKSRQSGGKFDLPGGEISASIPEDVFYSRDNLSIAISQRPTTRRGSGISLQHGLVFPDMPLRSIRPDRHVSSAFTSVLSSNAGPEWPAD